MFFVLVLVCGSENERSKNTSEVAQCHQCRVDVQRGGPAALGPPRNTSAPEALLSKQTDRTHAAEGGDKKLHG